MNKRTLELRELMNSLVADVHYQERLRVAFAKRRLHPSTELRIWEYAIGKPKEQIEMSGQLSMDARLAAEREALRSLSLPELEELAAESQRLVDRAVAMANENARKARMLVAVSPAPVANPQVAATGKLREEPPSSPGSRAILPGAARDGVEG